MAWYIITLHYCFPKWQMTHIIHTTFSFFFSSFSIYSALMCVCGPAENKHVALDLLMDFNNRLDLVSLYMYLSAQKW